MWITQLPSSKGLPKAAIAREPLPPTASLAWALAAGMSGSLGIAALYRGLATDRAALVVPLSGVVGAAIPVAFAATVAGVLPPVQQAGLLTALAGIFLVSRGHGARRAERSPGLAFGALAGVGFGGFFLCLAQVASGHVFTPLAVAGCGSLGMATVVVIAARVAPPLPWRNPTALLAGALDATGAMCYLLAVGWIRLDVAAVLSSFSRSSPMPRTGWPASHSKPAAARFSTARRPAGSSSAHRPCWGPAHPAP